MIKKILNYIFSLFRRSKKYTFGEFAKVKIRNKTEIYSVITRTPGGNKVWVNSNVGTIKKPVNSLSRQLIETAPIFDKGVYLQFIKSR